MTMATPDLSRKRMMPSGEVPTSPDGIDPIEEPRQIAIRCMVSGFRTEPVDSSSCGTRDE